MGDTVLDSLLIKIVPEFKRHWELDDIYKEADGTFTPHGVMGSFLEFYQGHYAEFSTLQISTLCIELEEIVSSDLNDTDHRANAICTMFLEILVDTPPGIRIEPFLGRQCTKYWNCYKS
ncbi:hypothetical protein [Pseudomonas leptonychotis]|uniref:hypothetical protein n=1 Tax=Pseudomonas leptonychotis TaxID=2448482 RepID=UPI0039EE04CF